MTIPYDTSALNFGSDDLRLPDELRAPVRAHLAAIRKRYVERGWAGRVGFGHHPALIVIDLALWWTDPRNRRQGSAVDSIVEAARGLLQSARAAKIPIFFTPWDCDPSMPPSPHDQKVKMELKPGDEKRFQLDPRLDRQPGERIIAKWYASSFKGANTLIVAGPRVPRYIPAGPATRAQRLTIESRHEDRQL